MRLNILRSVPVMVLGLWLLIVAMMGIVVSLILSPTVMHHGRRRPIVIRARHHGG
jgi:hypothetical protein